MDALRILVVDDETELVEALVERLELRGFQARGATSGREAVAVARENTFDVAVVDLKMPGMDGLQTIRQLRGTQPDLKCVLLTGHGAAENPEQGRQCGACDCMMKPVDIDVLTRTLREAAGRGTTE
jgi:DNA-binding response OmpR family regulator